MELCSVTTALVAVVVGLLTYLFWKSQQVYKTWESLGVPGPPKSSVIVGSMGDMRSKGFLTCFLEWRQKYGKMHGIYFPRIPTLVVHDLDLMREVFVKNFSNFHNRMPQPFLKYKPWEDGLLMLRDDHWKHVRSQLSPTFSSGKLKKMMPAIEKVVQNLSNHIAEIAKTGEDVELRELSGRFTMDTIAASAFGMDANCIGNPKGSFFTNGVQLLNQRAWLMPFLLTMPWLRHLGLTFVPTAPTNFFVEVINMALKDRRVDKKTYSDFLQLLVEAQKEGATGHVDKEIDHSAQLTTSTAWTNRKGLNDDEIRANAFLFFIGGYDTTSIVLSFTMFLIAAHPEVQKKAQQEVDSKLGKKAVTYETAQDLTYVDMCMNEGMRLYPPGFIIDRQAHEDCEVGGYPVKKGFRVLVPVYAIHRDPEYWPDPEKFDPERHSAENKAERHPMAFLPFGHGPRNCIGMRLAQLEIRMAIATVLQNYDVSLTDKSVNPPTLIHPQVQMKAKDGLWVKFSPRA